MMSENKKAKERWKTRLRLRNGLYVFKSAREDRISLFPEDVNRNICSASFVIKSVKKAVFLPPWAVSKFNSIILAPQLAWPLRSVQLLRTHTYWASPSERGTSPPGAANVFVLPQISENWGRVWGGGNPPRISPPLLHPTTFILASSNN
jgi:hypothetical protein